MSGSAMVQRLVFEASMRGAAGVEQSLSSIEAKGASAGASVDKGMEKAGAAAKGATSKFGALQESLIKNKSSMQAATSAGFALTAALAQTGSGMTRALLATGATTAALAAVPGPIGAIAATASVAISMLAALSQGMSANKNVADSLITSYTVLEDKVKGVEQSFSGLGIAVKAVSVETLIAIAQLEAMQGGLLTIDARRVKMADTAARPELVREIREREGELAVAGASGVGLETRQKMIDELNSLRTRLKEVDQRLKIADEQIAKQANDAILAERRLRALRAGETARIEAQLTPLPDRIAAAISGGLGQWWATVSGGRNMKPEAPKKDKAARAVGLSKEVEGLGATFHAVIQGFIETAFYADQAHKQELAALDELEKREQARYKLQNMMNAERERAWAKEKAQRKQAKELDKDNLERSREATEAAIDKGEAYFNVAAAALIAGESVIGAIKKQLNAEAQAEFLSSSWNALKYGALSIARFAMGDPAGGAAFAQSAGMFTTIAALTGGAVAATGGFGGGGGGSGGGGGGGGGTAPSSATIATPRESDKKEEVTINISFAGMPLATERAVQDAVAAAVVATANRRGSPLYNKLVR